MQVRLLTNMSDPFPKKIVRERLTGSSAVYLERLRDIVLGNVERLDFSASDLHCPNPCYIV